MGLWLRQEWDEAEACYHELLQADPNWVMAQNHLGYIAMARGQFLEAEEQFETYRFIAPDQANPHDSLGELLTLIGRYEDARNELEKALEVRPDFCASYDHLIRIDLLEQQFDQAEAVLARRQRQKDCVEMNPKPLVCSIAMWRPFARGDWEGTWQAAEEHDCLEPNRNEPMILAYSAAVRTGRFEQAHQMEEHLAQRLEKAGQYGKVDRDVQAALLAHMEGTRLEAEGDPAAAAERYATADRLLRYWTADGLAFFKLFNQLSLAGALAASGDPEGEEAVLRRVRSVNPRMEAVFYHDRGSAANPASRAAGTR
jgi:tetratricopeptide (TPR) repeat protein